MAEYTTFLGNAFLWSLFEKGQDQITKARNLENTKKREARQRKSGPYPCHEIEGHFQVYALDVDVLKAESSELLYI